MKSQFNKVQKLAYQLRMESAKLDKMINETWGFHYSETDDNRIIDTLDYATDDITFEEFKSRMNEYKTDFDSNNPFRAIP